MGVARLGVNVLGLGGQRLQGGKPRFVSPIIIKRRINSYRGYGQEGGEEDEGLLHFGVLLRATLGAFRRRRGGGGGTFKLFLGGSLISLLGGLLGGGTVAAARPT